MPLFVHTTPIKVPSDDHPLSGVTLNYIELKYPISFVLGRFLETDNFYMIKFIVNLYLEVCGKKFVPEKH